MSIRIDSSSDVFSRSLWATAGNTTSNPWTIMGWVKLINDRNTNSSVWGLGSGSSDYVVQTDVDGTTLNFYDGGAYDSETFALTVGTWYHIAVTRNTSSGAMSVYVDGTLRISNSNFNALSGILWTLGADSFTTAEWADAEFCDWRIWQAELTSSEVTTEKGSTTPVKASPYVVYRLSSAATAATDTSGNARSATVSGLSDGASEPTIYGGGGATGGPFPHFTRRAMLGGMIAMG